ncbi:MAG TPA: NeuD/PglB/VioB family sugar acetyltransferase [Bacteroidales bacterium]|jgi:sugar O-acyltransferase (sialic acid O-acetyltransferase NeuD family)|nr:NeuD/PglB/VioB family sugar acetyltransferase [Bacteroidales bacterium]HUM33543.1 NeuD/PglB/VioB family sugar acetyltransferase [Bacteroidales bacterium]
MKEKKLAIIGAGELGKQILNLLKYSIEKYNCIGFFDDTFKQGEIIMDSIPVIDNIKNIKYYSNKNLFDEVIIGIGYKHINFRSELYEKFKNKLNFAKITSAKSIIDESATVKNGVVIYPGCTIDKQVTINENVLINLGCIISHDSEIGANSFIAPGVVISGFVKIGKNCFIGSGTVIKDNIIIEDNVVIGAGSVVIRDVIKNSKIAGNPAKKI